MLVSVVVLVSAGHRNIFLLKGRMSRADFLGISLCNG